MRISPTHPALQILFRDTRDGVIRYGPIHTRPPWRKKYDPVTFDPLKLNGSTHHSTYGGLNRWFSRKLKELEGRGLVSSDGSIRVDPDFKRKPWTSEDVKKLFKDLTDEEVKSLLLAIGDSGGVS